MGQSLYPLSNTAGQAGRHGDWRSRLLKEGRLLCCVCRPPGSLGRETWVPFLCLPDRWSLGEGLLLVWEPGWRLVRPLMPGTGEAG